MLSQACPVANRNAMSVPKHWLITDYRIIESLAAIAIAMPPRSAIIIRAFALPEGKRALLIRRLRHIARARRHRLIWSGPQIPPGYAGRQGTGRRKDDAILVMPVHNEREAAAARRWRADAVLISPVHATRSHPGAPTLGVRGFARLAASAHCPAIGLGGMNAKRYRTLNRHGAQGWAGIDGWLPCGSNSRRAANQKRNCVPT